MRTEGLEGKEALLGSFPEIFFTIPHFDGYPAVLVRLDAIDLDQLREVITDAWLLQARNGSLRSGCPARRTVIVRCLRRVAASPRYSLAVTTDLSTNPRRDSRLRAAALDIDASSERGLESLSLGVGAVAFVLVALVALIVFRFEPAPISGPGSVGQFAAIASAVVAILVFLAGRYVMRDRAAGRRVGLLDVIDVAALSFAHGVIALLTWTLLAVILEESFIGAEVFALPLLIISGAAAAVTAYGTFYSATHMDLQLLAVLLAVFLAEGVIASMLTASDPDWWKDNLSALGMNDDISSLAFNLTLIVAGIIVTTLARYATQRIPTPNPQGRRPRADDAWSSWGSSSRSSACSRSTSSSRSTPASPRAWSSPTVCSSIRLPHWIPGMPRAFVLLGWLFLAVTLVLAVFFFVGYYTLTAVELVAGILVFTWIILFIRNAARAAAGLRAVARCVPALWARPRRGRSAADSLAA